MSQVITITLNPSLDATILTNPLNMGYYNHVSVPKHLDASGQGVNMSRALVRLDIPTHAFVTLGDDAISYAYEGLLTEETFSTTFIRYAGHTRSDTIILDHNNDIRTETHIVDESSVTTPHIVQNLLKALQKIVQPDDFVVCAGSLPHRIQADVYPQIIKIAHQAEAKAVVMSRGVALQQALNATPDLVILQQLDAEALFNYPVRTFSDTLSVARKLLERGCKAVLLVMSDYHSAILVNASDRLLAEITGMDFKGTESGVIDALAAGYLAGLTNQYPHDKALTLGMAAMAYTAEEIGNEFASIKSLDEHLPRISIKSVQTAPSTSE